VNKLSEIAFHRLANEGIARGKESDSPNPAFYTFSG